TLFTALVVSRIIFNVLVDELGWRRTSQLPMVYPALQRFLTPHIDWMKHRWTFLGILTVFLALSGAIVVHRGADMLSTEFRGGTQVALQFKNDERGEPIRLKRAEVERRVHSIAEKNPSNPELQALRDADIVPKNPEADGVTSSKFEIKTLATDG